MIASNEHGQPSLAPGSTCDELLVLPQLYLDLFFGETRADAPEAEPAEALLPDYCLAAE